MKILFIASHYPYPLNRGDSVRVYFQLRELSKHHSITLIAPIWDGSESHDGELKKYCKKIISVRLSSLVQLFRLFLGLFSSRPLQTHYYYSPRIAEEVQKELSTSGYDLIHVHLLRMAPAVQKIKDIPIVVDLCDSFKLIISRWLKMEKNLIKKMLLQIELKRCVIYEKYIARLYKTVFVCSFADKEAIGNIKSINIAPNGVDTDIYTPQSRAIYKRNIVFVGNYTYFPNADAVEYFARDIFPLILRKFPDARFQIIGYGASARLQSLSSWKNVEYVGEVADVRDYLKTAVVSVAPMRAGTGMQFKVLQSMAYGVPVVVTRFSLGNLPIVPEKHLLVANSSDEFAEQVIRLLSDQKLRERVSKNARELILAEYTWNKIVKDMDKLYSKAAM